MADTGTIQTKDPNARKNYRWDWAKWVSERDTAIAASEFIIEPAGGLQIVQQGYSDTATTVRLAAGTEGVTYKVTNRVTTADGEIDDRTMHIQVRPR